VAFALERLEYCCCQLNCIDRPEPLQFLAGTAARSMSSGSWWSGFYRPGARKLSRSDVMSGEMVDPLKWYTKEPTSKQVRIFFCVHIQRPLTACRGMNPVNKNFIAVCTHGEAVQRHPNIGDDP